MSFWEIPNDLKYMIGVEANKELPYDKKNYYKILKNQ
jgi:hypothetical protein